MYVENAGSDSISSMDGELNRYRTMDEGLKEIANFYKSGKTSLRLIFSGLVENHF